MSVDELKFYMEVYFSGRVQGVGFRYSTLQVARGYEVTGFVRNMSDGRVSIEVEGEEKECRLFVRAVEDELDSYIRKCEISDGRRAPQHISFSIR
tara:strand:- start:1325 stop:1609 length:285 start_codon:yes stop_codon:yes gene_type:complete